jgi:hypothetical protein
MTVALPYFNLLGGELPQPELFAVRDLGSGGGGSTTFSNVPAGLVVACWGHGTFGNRTSTFRFGGVGSYIASHARAAGTNVDCYLGAYVNPSFASSLQFQCAFSSSVARSGVSLVVIPGYAPSTTPIDTASVNLGGGVTNGSDAVVTTGGKVVVANAILSPTGYQRGIDVWASQNAGAFTDRLAYGGTSNVEQSSFYIYQITGSARAMCGAVW